MTAAAADATVETVRSTAYTVPTDAPESDGTLDWDSTTVVLVEIGGGGCVGVGWTYGPAVCARYVDTRLTPILVGSRVMDVGGLFAAMVRAVRNDPRPGAVGYALSAVDVAVWDLKAKLLGLPLCSLLGAVHRSVPVYGSGGFVNYDDAHLRRQLDGWVHGQQIPRVKIKIGERRGTREDRDLERIGQARTVIGGDAELFVDANGGYGRKQAIRVAHRAEPYSVTWFEEPVSSDDLTGLRQVRQGVEADVTAGEYGCEPHYFRRMCASGAVDCLQADASRCGGVTGWLAAATLAAAHGLDVSAHCAPHLHVSLAAATANLRHLEWFHDHVRIESMFFDGTLDPSGGTVTPARDTAGHGLTPRHRVIEKYRSR